MAYEIKRLSAGILLIAFAGSLFLTTFPIISFGGAGGASGIFPSGATTYQLSNDGGIFKLQNLKTSIFDAIDTDAGKLINTGYTSLCPKILSIVTNELVPLCSIQIKPGIYNGTTTISIKDDWDIRLIGDNPSLLTIQNPRTCFSNLIDIESTNGVVQLLHNSGSGGTVSGGVIDIENLCFRTKTIISSPLESSELAVLSMGNTNTSPSRIIMKHVGVKDDSTQNQDFIFRDSGASDLTEVDDLYGFGTTFHSQMYVNVNQFWDYGEIALSNNPSSTPQTDAYEFNAVVNAVFYVGFLSLGGGPGYNGFLQMAQGSVNPAAHAFFGEITVDTEQSVNNFAAAGNGFRVNIAAPIVINEYLKAGPFQDILNSSFTGGVGSTINIGAGALQILHSTTAKNPSLSLLSFPFGNYGINSGNFGLGMYYDGQPSPTASTTYVVVGIGIANFTSTGGTGVVLTVKDANANCVVCGASTITGMHVLNGWSVNFGAFTGSPTVKTYLDYQ